MFKRLAVALTALMTLIWSMSCSAAKPDKWLIYWYVCGTDIESCHISFDPNTDLMSDNPNDLILSDPDRNPGSATRSIKEVENAAISPNVKIFMQAGGTYIWGHPKFRDLNAKFNTRALTVGADNYLAQKGMVFKEWYLLKSKFFPQKDGGFLEEKLTPVSNGKIGRYVYDKNHHNWHPRGELLPISGEKNTETDMGSQAGLVSFLQAGQKLEKEIYPDGNVRRVLIFVDHGVTDSYGLYGICKDAYTGNSLSLKEIQNAFSQVQSGWVNSEEKPFEVVAFDACVMSEYETAVAVEAAANYMVASQEETDIRVGLGYTNLLNNLSKNPQMSGAELAKVICKTYWEDSKKTDKERNIDANTILTSSVIDLRKMEELKNAYENFTLETYNLAQKNSYEFVQNFVKFNKAAAGSEKYPSTFGAVHFNVQNSSPLFVDLREFAKNLGHRFEELKPASDGLVKSINNAVIYQKRGESLSEGGGLSIFYPFGFLNKKDAIDAYQKYALKDKLASETQGKLYKILYTQVTQNQNLFDLSDLKDSYVDVEEKAKTAWVELDEEQRQKIEGVRAQLIYVKAIDDEIIQGVYLGSDSNIAENDKEPGKFKSIFRGKWVRMDNQLALVNVVSDTTIRNKNGKKIGGNEILSIPITLNNQIRNLLVSCKYPSERFTIIGIPPQYDVNEGTFVGQFEGLKKGDIVTPLYLKFNLSKDDVYEMEENAEKTYKRSLENLTDEQKAQLLQNQNLLGFVSGIPITIGDKPLKIEIGDNPLPDGNYVYIFEFVNPIGGKNVTADEMAIFKIRDGKIVEVKHSDDIEELKDLS